MTAVLNLADRGAAGLRGARAADPSIQVLRDQGTPVARFKVGDAHCVLKAGRIRCAPASK
jgi:hypothetical protein